MTITTAVATTGIWNLGFKFGLPIVAVVLVAVTGQSTGGAVGVALAGVLPYIDLEREAEAMTPACPPRKVGDH